MVFNICDFRQCNGGVGMRLQEKTHNGAQTGRDWRFTHLISCILVKFDAPLYGGNTFY